MAGEHVLAGGHVWGLIGSGCMMWQDQMFGRGSGVVVDWIMVYDVGGADDLAGGHVLGLIGYKYFTSNER